MERNWAGNIEYGAARWHQPESVADVQRIVAGSRAVRALGSRHSFNRIADTDGDIIAMGRLNEIIDLDPDRRLVTVGAGIRYGELAVYLQSNGWALHNLASLPHISVGGACATATHGSGDANGNLATAVRGMQLLTADGDLLDVSTEDHEDFNGMVVGLGACGIVTAFSLAIEPTYDVAQEVFERVALAEACDRFDEIMSSGYSVSMFTDWRSDAVNQIWRKRRVDGTNGAVGAVGLSEVGDVLDSAVSATRRLHPIAALSAEPCTEQLGIAGPWHERLPHFRLAFTPSSGDELQSEYFVARSDAVEAIRSVAALGDLLSPIMMTSEIRSIAADGLWLSPCFGRESVALHFTWVRDWPAVQAVLPTLEAALAPFAPRPHWGKVFTMTPAQVRAGYPELARFEQLLGRLDPGGKFRNRFVDDFVG